MMGPTVIIFYYTMYFIFKGHTTVKYLYIWILVHTPQVIPFSTGGVCITDVEPCYAILLFASEYLQLQQQTKYIYYYFSIFVHVSEIRKHHFHLNFVSHYKLQCSTWILWVIHNVLHSVQSCVGEDSRPAQHSTTK